MATTAETLKRIDEINTEYRSRIDRDADTIRELCGLADKSARQEETHVQVYQRVVAFTKSLEGVLKKLQADNAKLAAENTRVATLAKAYKEKYLEMVGEIIPKL